MIAHTANTPSTIPTTAPDLGFFEGCGWLTVFSSASEFDGVALEVKLVVEDLEVGETAYLIVDNVVCVLNIVDLILRNGVSISAVVITPETEVGIGVVTDGCIDSVFIGTEGGAKDATSVALSCSAVPVLATSSVAGALVVSATDTSHSVIVIVLVLVVVVVLEYSSPGVPFLAQRHLNPSPLPTSSTLNSACTVSQSFLPEFMHRLRNSEPWSGLGAWCICVSMSAQTEAQSVRGAEVLRGILAVRVTGSVIREAVGVVRRRIGRIRMMKDMIDMMTFEFLE